MSFPSRRQFAAARALLGWTARRLADEAGVHANTVGNLERSLTTIGLASVREIQKVLEREGIVFTEHGVELPPRPKKRRR